MHKINLLTDTFAPVLLSDRQEGPFRELSFRTCDAVCSEQIDFTLEGDTIRRVQYTRGCHGNTQGIAALCEGMKVQDVITRLGGIDCHGRGTSCPDQLARVLRIARIVDMERRMNTVSAALAGSADAPQRDIDALRGYMDSGQWLSDYEADERGEIPEGIQRGVLSEDSLYNLLDEVNRRVHLIDP